MPKSTFIIPIKIDSEIRLKNIKLTLRYLLQHTDSLIKIIEADDQQRLFLDDSYKSRIDYKFVVCDRYDFHRTKFINEMLSEVKTPVTINYDADVLLAPEAYIHFENMLCEDRADVIYPYGFNEYDQKKVSHLAHECTKFTETLNLNDIDKKYIDTWFCKFGHVQFFKTSVYRDGYMENENYKHWCPEDEERGIRFVKLGYRVLWFRNYVYHQEHPPSILKEPSNKKEIDHLHGLLLKMNKDELVSYYSNQNYIKKYLM
jgi:hypothetical protein